MLSGEKRGEEKNSPMSTRKAFTILNTSETEGEFVCPRYKFCKVESGTHASFAKRYKLISLANKYSFNRFEIAIPIVIPKVYQPSVEKVQLY